MEPSKKENMHNRGRSLRCICERLNLSTNSTVDFREFVLTTAEESCIFASSLVKNEDESLETRGQKPLNWIGLKDTSIETEKRLRNQPFLFLSVPKFEYNIKTNF